MLSLLTFLASSLGMPGKSAYFQGQLPGFRSLWGTSILTGFPIIESTALLLAEMSLARFPLEQVGDAFFLFAG